MEFQSIPEPDCRGQALIEFLFSAALLIAFAVGVAPIFKAKWDRTECAFQVFEKTRSTLNSPGFNGQELSMISLSGKHSVRVTNQAGSLRGMSSCGDREEVVVLQKLEAGD